MLFCDFEYVILSERSEPRSFVSAYGSLWDNGGSKPPPYGVILSETNGDPAKANSLCGERRSQDTGGIFRLREMEHCGLCFDEGGGRA
jgi:hypothetical protein